MSTKILTLLLFLGACFAVGEVGAVFNGEEEKPGLREEVLVKQETQVAQGEITRIVNRHGSRPAVTDGLASSSEKAAAPSPRLQETASSSWLGWVQSAVLLAGIIFVFYWMLRIS